ncbi:hypothetical protein BVG16_07735 [Paenibacillus selenitireducens]|uniref:ABC transporter domain-containing protein n=1 Tax=Paenibacillus selenitireducens TaxID=1324314 RepID=A0A1T2XLA7_9BACL|nr:ABC transporter ATP-binding protein [Paenibacillus selenitireducens]OPA80598.1 hypothetical protein BVG16_07735 [Paenibacillus selenitireducens]
MINKSIKKDLKLIKRGCSIIRQLSPGQIELSLFKSVLNALIPYISIYMLAVIIDELTQNRNTTLLAVYVGVTCGGTLLLMVLSNLISKKVAIKEGMFEARFENYMNDKKLSMNFSQLEDPNITQLREKIIAGMFATDGGITAIVGRLTSIVEGLVSVIIAIIISYGAIMATDSTDSQVISVVNSGWFSLLLILAIVICIFITVKNSKKVDKKVFELYQDGATNNGYIEYYHYIYLEDDHAGKDVRIYDQKKLIIDEVLKKGRLPWLKIVNGTYRLHQQYFSVNLVISVFIGGLVYIFVGLKALAGTISLGAVTKTYAAIAKLAVAIAELSVSISQIRSNNNYLELLFTYLDLPVELNEGKEILTVNNDEWEIEFHNVSFRYPSSEKYALKNISMKISSNSRTAIVGMNGSGKTTMIKLLCRLYSPESGYITLNGKDIKEYDYDAYLNNFSVVFQDFQLLSFSIGQNVAASKEYDENRVWSALEMAGIDDRVRTLPLNLEQSLYKRFEENGIDISGGEAQKIALARAVYKNAPFVILDEPTAALDPISEAEVYSKFNNMVGNKTALFISHRLSSCRFCDTIMVFDEGQIIQIGTHTELLTNLEGKYYELWNAQAQYYQNKQEDSTDLNHIDDNEYSNI